MKRWKSFILLVAVPILAASVTYIGLNSSGNQKYFWFLVWVVLWAIWFWEVLHTQFQKKSP